MFYRFTQITSLILFVLILCVFVSAQETSSSSLVPAVQSTEEQDLGAALALTDLPARAAALEKFLETYPRSERANSAKETLIQSLAYSAEKQLASQNIEGALRTFEKALSFLPQPISDSFFEGTLIRIPFSVAVRGYRVEAVSMARKIEAASMENAIRLGALGEFYLSLEAASDAIRALETAVQISPKDIRIHKTLGAAYRIALRLNDSTKEYKQVIELDANDKRAYYELANLSRAQGVYGEALNLYQRQLAVDPTHTPSIKGMALTLLAQGKADAAKAELDKAIRLKNSESEITQDFYLQTQMAFYHLIQGNLEQARQAADLALKAEPRYSWARIAVAEIHLNEGKYFEAEQQLLAARKYGNFPSLEFALGKLYLSVEDFEGSAIQFAKAFSYSQKDNFKTRLGGVLEITSDRVADLLILEQQAAMFLFEPATSYAQFRLIENLVRLEYLIAQADNSTNRSDKRVSAEELEKAAQEFVEAESQRQPFRALYLAQRLAQKGVALELVTTLAKQALGKAEAATEAEGSLKDYPNYDRDGRLRIFRGRAKDAEGWALFKAGKNTEAITALTASVQAYDNLPEGKRARWHLAAAKESAGELKEALDLYLAAYEKPAEGSDYNRPVIENLYRKVHGSLKGLDELIGKPAITLAENRSVSTEKTEPARQSESVVSTAAANQPNRNDKEIAAIIESKKSSPVSTEGKEQQKITQNFSVVIPKETNSTLAETNKEKPAEEAPKKLPEPVIVLPSVRDNRDLSGSLVAAVAPVLIPQLTQSLNEAEEPAPPPLALSAKTTAEPIASRSRFAATRPRRAVTADDAPPQEKPQNTRKRRISEPSDPPEEK